MQRCGLLGKKLGHSYSAEIHKFFGDYSYRLFETEPEQLNYFLKKADFDGINVTIPYKKAVIPFCSFLSKTATATNSVNTIVNKDGKLYGYNTDVYGFTELLEHNGIDVKDKKVLIFGSGGASNSVEYALKQLGALPTVISRKSENNYTNLFNHYDAEILVNATPVGMYPKIDEQIVDVSLFTGCKAVIDLVYNPANTYLLQQAKSLGIKAVNGIYMLVAQAAKSAELFNGRSVSQETKIKAESSIKSKMVNTLLIGMPGCGKTVLGKALAALTNRVFSDSDAYITEKYGLPPHEILSKYGEQVFRKYETKALLELCKQSGAVIATGGGCVTVSENEKILKANSKIVFIERDINELATLNRPLSKGVSLDEMYKKRKPLYEAIANITVTNNADVITVAQKIAEVENENSCY